MTERLERLREEQARRSGSRLGRLRAEQNRRRNETPGRDAAYPLARFYEGAANTLGLPVDIATGIGNAANDAYSLATTGRPAEVDAFRGSLGGSEWLRERAREARLMGDEEWMQPLDGNEAIIGGAAEATGASVVPYAGMAGRARATAGTLAADATAAERIGHQIIQPFRSRPMAAATTEAGLAAASGGAAGTAEAAGAPEWSTAAGTFAPFAVGALTHNAGRAATWVGREAPERLRRARAAFSQFGEEPTLAEATGGAGARIIEQRAGDLPGGDAIALNRDQRVAANMGRRVNQIADEITTDGLDGARPRSIGPARTREDAGEAIATGLRSYMDRSRATVSAAYDRADQAVRRALGAAGADRLAVVMNRTQALLRDVTRMEPGAPTLTGEGGALRGDDYLYRLVQQFQRDFPDGVADYDTARALLTRLGRQIDFESLTPGRDVATLRRAYGALSEEIQGAVANLGRGPANLMSRARRSWAVRQGNVDKYVQPALRRAETAENLYSWLVSDSGQLASSRIRRVRQMVGEREWRRVASVFLRRMGMAPRSSQSADNEVFSPQRFLSNWVRLRQSDAFEEVLGAVRGSRSVIARYRQDMDDIAYAAELMRNAHPYTNTSNTGRSVAYLTVGSSIGGGAFTGNMPLFFAGLSAVGGSVGGQLLFMNPRFVSWLANSRRVPIEQVPGALARLLTIAQDMTPDEQEAAVDVYEHIETTLESQEGVRVPIQRR